MAGDIESAASAVYQDGPASNPTEPNKAEIRRLFALIQAALTNLTLLISSGAQLKAPVVVASTGNVNLAGLATGSVIDGVTVLTGDRVLLKDQTTGAENGVYVIGASAPATRSADADQSAEMPGLTVFVQKGSANGGTSWACATPAPISVGSTALLFVKINDQVAVNTTVSDALSQISQMIAKIVPTGFWPYPWAVTDSNGQVLIAVNAETGLAEIVTGDLPGSGMLDPDYAWAICDASGKVAFGIRYDGGAVLGAAPLLDADYARVETNEDGEIIRAVEWSGFVDQGSGIRGPSAVYTKGAEGSRDVYLFANGVEQRISNGGDNWAPHLSMGIVRYLSNQSGETQFVTVKLIDVLPYGSAVTSIYHVLGSGQSLSVGVKTNALSTTALYPSKLAMFNAGILTLGSTQDTPDATKVLTDEQIAYLVPALSQVRETPLMQIGIEVAKRRPASSGALVSAHGIGSQGILDLSKGTVPYANLVKAATRAAQIASMHGLAYLPAVDWIQGEHDNIQAVGWYKPKLVQLQADLTTDINAATGHTGQVKLLGDQISSWTAYDRPSSGVPFDQLAAALENPTKIKCVGPKYFLTHFSDGIHLTTESSARLGAYHGRAHAAEAAGSAWLPLYIASAVRTGNQVVLTYAGNDGNLTLDTSLVTDPGDKGFRWIDAGDGNTVTVTNVAVTASNKITLTLSAVPTGTGQKVGYADIGNSGANAGPTTGPRGNVRDSSTDTDQLGNNMFNWACHQQAVVS